MKKILSFFDSRRYIVYIALGVLLLSMTFKSQVVILSYGDEYSLRMEYTVYGYCIRASAGLKATEPAVYNEVYVGNSMSTSILKAVSQLEKLGGEGGTVRIMTTGFPKNNDKLELEIQKLLVDSGRNAEIIDDIKILS